MSDEPINWPALQHAADDLARIGMQYQHFMALALQVTKIGSLQNYAAETEQRLAAARKDEAEAATRLAELGRQIKTKEAAVAKLDTDEAEADRRVNVLEAEIRRLTPIVDSYKAHEAKLPALEAAVANAQGKLDAFRKAVGG